MPIKRLVSPYFAAGLIGCQVIGLLSFPTWSYGSIASFSVTALRLPPSADYGYVRSLGDDGVAVGYAHVRGVTEFLPVAWPASGVATPLSITSDYDAAIAFDRLPDGRTVGIARLAVDDWGKAAIWTDQAGPQILPLPANRQGSSARTGTGSIVVGTSFEHIDIDHQLDRLMVWQNHQIVSETTFPGASNVNVGDINASGTYVGFFNSLDGSVWGQFIGNRDQVTVLDFHEYRGLDIAGINDDGHFVGSYTIDDFQNYVGYVSYDCKTIKPLPPLAAYTTSAIDEINNAGEIIGMNWDSAGNEIAVYYTSGATTPFDLNSLIDPIPGVHLVRGIDINNHGQILVEGATAEGYRYFVLTPIPEPAIGLCMASIVGSGRARTGRRRNCRRAAA